MDQIKILTNYIAIKNEILNNKARNYTSHRLKAERWKFGKDAVGNGVSAVQKSRRQTNLNQVWSSHLDQHEWEQSRMKTMRIWQD